MITSFLWIKLMAETLAFAKSNLSLSALAHSVMNYVRDHVTLACARLGDAFFPSRGGHVSGK